MKIINNKITKDRLDHHFEYDWFKYVIILFAAIFLWWFVYDFIDKPKSYEQIEIFGVNVIADNGVMTQLNEDFVQYLKDEMDDETIKSIILGNDIGNYEGIKDGSDTTFYTLLETRFLMNDLIIADEDIFGLLAFRGNLTKFDKLNTEQKEEDKQNGIANYDYRGVFDVTDKLSDDDSLSYYKLDENKFNKINNDFNMYDREEPYDEKEPPYYTSLIGNIYGIELNALIPEDANGLIFPFGNELDEDGQPTAVKKKYYIGVIRTRDMGGCLGSSSGANVGEYNVHKEDRSNAQAFDFIKFLIANPEKYKI